MHISTLPASPLHRNTYTVPAENTPSPNSEEILAYAQKHQETAVGILDDTMKKLGIAPDWKVTVESNGLGATRVNSDMPDAYRERFETALNGNLEFINSYNHAAGSLSFHEQLKKSYAHDRVEQKTPEAAVAPLSREARIIPNFVMEFMNGEGKMVQNGYKQISFIS